MRRVVRQQRRDRDTAKRTGCGRDRRCAASRVIDRHSGAGRLVEQLQSPGCVRNSRGRYAVARQARALRGEQIAGTRSSLEFDGSNERAGRVLLCAAGSPGHSGGAPLQPNKRMKLPVGPADAASARAAIRCRCNSSLSGTASWWPPFGSTSVAVVGGPTAAYARIRYADAPSIGSAASPGEFGSVCFSGAVR
jgi:hypothetical protein